MNLARHLSFVDNLTPDKPCGIYWCVVHVTGGCKPRVRVGLSLRSKWWCVNGAHWQQKTAGAKRDNQTYLYLWMAEYYTMSFWLVCTPSENSWLNFVILLTNRWYLSRKLLYTCISSFVALQVHALTLFKNKIVNTNLDVNEKWVIQLFGSNNIIYMV